jgi:multidrug efflux pump subunit AcrA (membrane-fusion protein)
MNAPTRFAAAVTVLALALAGCAGTSSSVSVVGTVTDPAKTVAIPSLSVPMVSLDAGFTQSGATTTATANTSASVYQIGTTQQVAKVLVHEGETVQAGQILATLDRSALTTQVEVTKADQAVSRSQVGLLTTAINDTYTKANDVATAKTKVSDAIATLTKTLAQVKAAKPKLKQARADLAAKLTQAEYLLAHYPPVPPPGTPSKAELTAMIGQLKAGIAQIDVQLAKLAKAEPLLTSGLTQARSGLAKLNTALTKISDARRQLRGLRDLAKIAADIAGVPVALANVQLNLATITAPVDGVITWVAGAGERLMTGASVATIRQTGPSKVTAWLSPTQLGQVCLNDSARLVGDWMSAGQGVTATLTRIAPTADFPPSSTATDETHLTRAVAVELTATAELPAGVPMEINISGCHASANQTEKNR